MRSGDLRRCAGIFDGEDVSRLYVFGTRAIWIIAAAFTACAAIRLARFNVETEKDDDHLTFIGLPRRPPPAPSPASRFCFTRCGAKGIRCSRAAISIGTWAIFAGFTLVLGVLMVSRIPYPHVVNQLLSGQRSLGHVVALLFSLVVIVAFQAIACRSFAPFCAGSAVRYAWQRWRNRQQETEPLF